MNTTENIDIEKQTDSDGNVDNNNEPLEKIKEKPLPGINASTVMLYGIFISMFTIGWISLNSCSINRLIPIYLIVSGFCGVLSKILFNSDNKLLSNLALFAGFIYIIWQLLGTYYVYKEYQPNYDYKLGLYCSRLAFLLSFWILTLQYTVSGFILVVSGCYMMMKNDFQKK